MAGADTRTIVIAGAAVAISFASGLWSLVNPRGDLAEIKQTHVTKEQHQLVVTHFMSELQRVERELRELKGIAVPRELFAWRVDQLEKTQTIQRDRIVKLNETVNVTYSAKDALQQIDRRIADLERAARGAK